MKTKSLPCYFIFCLLLGLSQFQVAAKNVRLPARSVNICVEKQKKVIQLKTQAKYWQINGKKSNKSTWSLRGNSARLKADYATANIIAKCFRRGAQTFNIGWMLNFNDPNRYQMRITVNCISCGDRKALNRLGDTIRKGINFKLAGRHKKAKRTLDNALKQLRRLLERDVLDPELEDFLGRRLGPLLSELKNAQQLSEEDLAFIQEVLETFF